MKKLACNILLFIATVPAFAQIENGGFEYWQTNINGVEEPNGWTSDFRSFIPTINHSPAVEKELSAHSGSYAITLKNFVEIIKQGEDTIQTNGNYGNLLLGEFDPNDYTFSSQTNKREANCNYRLLQIYTRCSFNF